MSVRVSRPEGSKKKISSKEEFELCYLRHKYLRKAKRNPTKAEMEPYNKIMKNETWHTCATYGNLLGAVGLDKEDVFNIAQVHLVSFLGLFALERDKKKLEAFKDKFWEEKAYQAKKPDILNKNKATFTNFLRQRFEELIRICRQKSRNIKGVPAEEFQAFVGTKKPPLVKEDLLIDHESFGYKKMDMAIFRTIKNRAKVGGNKSFHVNGKYYVIVPTEHKILSEEDLIGAGLDMRDNMHNMGPDRVLGAVEDKILWEGKKEEFNSLDEQTRLGMLQNFITSNQENPKMTEELKAARAMLKQGVFK